MICSAPMHTPDDPLLHTTLGVYRLVRLLGVGGMGRVYLGEHINIGSRVAIKVLAPECGQRKDLIERFFAEARAVNMIRHDNIVSILDLLTLPDGRPYIVMEFLDGETFSDIIASRNGPAVLFGGLTKVIADVLQGLAAAHEKGIVHRDLKPENIFISSSGRVKILDFGIAKLAPELGGAVTNTGSLLGTPHYMSPEQTLGKPVDFRADIYATGVMLYEALTGRRPFQGDSMFDLMRQHVDAPVPSARLLVPTLPEGLDHIIAMAMAKDPNHRFNSAHVMIAALQNATHTLPPEHWNPVLPTGGPPATRSVGWGSGGSWQTAPAPHVIQQSPSAAQVGNPPSLGISATVPDVGRPSRRGRNAALAIVAIAAITGIGLFVASRNQGTNHANSADSAASTTAGTPAGTPATDPANAALDQKLQDLEAKLAQVQAVGERATQVARAAGAAGSAGPAAAEAGSDNTGDADADKDPDKDADTDKDADADEPAIDAAPARSTYQPPADLYADALQRARVLASDVELLRVDADRWPGDSQWQVGGKNGAEFRFVSPSRLKAGNKNCEIIVEYTGEGVEVREFVQCTGTVIKMPSCSFKEIRQLAEGQGAPHGPAGNYYYFISGKETPRWRVNIAGWDKFVFDTCKP